MAYMTTDAKREMKMARAAAQRYSQVAPRLISPDLGDAITPNERKRWGGEKVPRSAPPVDQARETRADELAVIFWPTT